MVLRNFYYLSACEKPLRPFCAEVTMAVSRKIKSFGDSLFDLLRAQLLRSNLLCYYDLPAGFYFHDEGIALKSETDIATRKHEMFHEFIDSDPDTNSCSILVEESFAYAYAFFACKDKSSMREYASRAKYLRSVIDELWNDRSGLEKMVEVACADSLFGSGSPNNWAKLWSDVCAIGYCDITAFIFERYGLRDGKKIARKALKLIDSSNSVDAGINYLNRRVSKIARASVLPIQKIAYLSNKKIYYLEIDGKFFVEVICIPRLADYVGKLFVAPIRKLKKKLSEFGCIEEECYL